MKTFEHRINARLVIFRQSLKWNFVLTTEPATTQPSILLVVLLFGIIYPPSTL